MKKLLHLYGGFVIIALSAIVTLAAYAALEEPLIERPQQQGEWSVNFIGKIADVFCFGCVTAHVGRMNYIQQREAQAAVNAAVDDVFAKIKEDARKFLVWPFLVILLSLCYELWRFRIPPD